MVASAKSAGIPSQYALTALAVVATGIVSVTALLTMAFPSAPPTWTVSDTPACTASQYRSPLASAPASLICPKAETAVPSVFGALVIVPSVEGVLVADRV